MQWIVAGGHVPSSLQGTSAVSTTPGVSGTNSVAGTGVEGKSALGEGVHGETNGPASAAVAGIALNPKGTGAGIYGESQGKGPAGFFKGIIQVTKDIQVLGGDCAEQFDVVDSAGS